MGFLYHFDIRNNNFISNTINWEEEIIYLKKDWF
jgi:hypothetical protein